MTDFRTDLEYEQKITELYLKPFYKVEQDLKPIEEIYEILK